jgi:hypothetical protein
VVDGVIEKRETFTAAEAGATKARTTVTVAIVARAEKGKGGVK